MLLAAPSSPKTALLILNRPPYCLKVWLDVPDKKVETALYARAENRP